MRLILAAIGFPLGVLMALYTGFLLSAAWTIPGGRWYVPLWDTTYLPVLLLLSALSTGLAASGLAALVAGHLGRRRVGEGAAEDAWAVAKPASLVDVATVLAEGAWVYSFLATFAVGTLGQQLAFNLVTRDGLARWFWGGFVAVGLVAPLLASIIHAMGERLFRARMGWLLGAKFVLILVGGLVLRYVIVWGGDMKAPLALPPSMRPIPSALTLPPLAGFGG